MNITGYWLDELREATSQGAWPCDGSSGYQEDLGIIIFICLTTVSSTTARYHASACRPYGSGTRSNWVVRVKAWQIM